MRAPFLREEKAGVLGGGRGRRSVQDELSRRTRPGRNVAATDDDALHRRVLALVAELIARDGTGRVARGRPGDLRAGPRPHPDPAAAAAIEAEVETDKVGA
jgi:hypothetical protein